MMSTRRIEYDVLFMHALMLAGEKTTLPAVFLLHGQRKVGGVEGAEEDRD